MDCIFCSIVAGESPAHKVYENDRVLAFIDIFPKTKGHVLVIPKKHAENIFDISQQDLHAVADAAKLVAEKQKSALLAGGVSLFQLNGKLGQQTVFHYHVHVMPRYEDNQKIEFRDKHTSKEGEFEELAKKLSCE